MFRVLVETLAGLGIILLAPIFGFIYLSWKLMASILGHIFPGCDFFPKEKAQKFFSPFLDVYKGFTHIR